MEAMAPAGITGKVGTIKQAVENRDKTLLLELQLPHRCASTACTQSGDALAVVTDAGSVYVIQLKQGRYVLLDQYSSTPGTAVTFVSRLTRKLFVGFSDGRIRCYDMLTKSHVATLEGPRSSVLSLAASPSSDQLLSTSADNVHVWDTEQCRRLHMPSDLPYGSVQAAYTPDGQNMVVAAVNGTMTLVNSKSMQQSASTITPLGYEGHHFSPTTISISDNGRMLLVGCRSPALLLLYQLQTMEFQHAVQLPDEMHGILQLQFLPDSTSAAGAASSLLSISLGHAQPLCTFPSISQTDWFAPALVLTLTASAACCRA